MRERNMCLTGAWVGVTEVDGGEGNWLRLVCRRCYKPPPQGSPQTSRPEDTRSQRSSLRGARRLRAGRVCVGTAAGRAKPPGGWPGGNVSRRGSAGPGAANCTRRGAATPGGGWSQKRTVGGRPVGLGSAGAAVWSLQGFSRRVDTLSVLSPICRV